MTVLLKKLATKAAAAVTPIHVVDRASFATHLKTAPAATRRWLEATGFAGEANRHVLVPAADGSLLEVWAGVGDVASPWALAACPRQLPLGRYRLADDGLAVDDTVAALSWELGSYHFDLYKPAAREAATLVLSPGLAAERGLMLATAMASVRDLVNTPAEHMGPAELAEAVRLVASQHGAKFKQTVGDALLKAGFPAIHAVGRAADRAPRLIELNWGSSKHPKLTLVGKGVCFDSGGLNIKGADGMRLMKKDMGGAANALGLAQMIMALKLPVQLQLLIPAVENAISGNAFRPGDVFKTRQGLYIEIGNTDAEGRVILCDALAYAAEGQPALLIDMATLTGAARVALGPHLPALFSRDTALARQLMDDGLALDDPLWQLPLWTDYHERIASSVADIVNTGRNGLGGSITAALFLADFVPASIPWLHIDLFAWNDAARPGRPVGGEAQTLRTLLHHLETRFVA
jgi:leucyl aminopeptidase